MIISAKVKAGARNDKISEEEGFYLVSIRENREKGKANQKIIDLLSDHFKVSKSSIRFKSGRNSTNKIIEIRGL